MLFTSDSNSLVWFYCGLAVNQRGCFKGTGRLSYPWFALISKTLSLSLTFTFVHGLSAFLLFLFSSAALLVLSSLLAPVGPNAHFQQVMELCQTCCTTWITKMLYYFQFNPNEILGLFCAFKSKHSNQRDYFEPEVPVSTFLSWLLFVVAMY